jgi:hypothetical protein
VFILRLVLVVSLSGLSVTALGQQTSPSLTSSSATQDPQAVTLAVSSLSTLNSDITISDVILTGTATRIAGSDVESGTFTLEAKGTTESRVELDLSGGKYVETRTSLAGYVQGNSSGPDGSAHAAAMHNCFTDAVWFLPQLSSLSAFVNNANYTVTYVGAETWQGSAVQHLRFSQSLPTDDTPTLQLLNHLSTVDIRLDSTSGLPVSMAFMVHPDNNGSTDIPVEIRYSSYKILNGVRVPLQVQKYINNGLVLDLNVTSATFNNGLSDSNFAL